MAKTGGLLPVGISIHAPREGCDVGHYVLGANGSDFNPRTP